MLKNFRSKIVWYFFILLGTILSGCGSNNTTTITRDVNDTEILTDENITYNNNSIEDNTTDNNITINGKVIDGEISGATIFLDLNKNSKLDISEPTTKSKADGRYTLYLTKTHTKHTNYINQSSPLVAFGGTDIRTDKPFDGYLVSMTEGRREVIITPMTTLIAQSIQGEITQNIEKTIFEKSSDDNIIELQNRIDAIKDNLAILFGIKKELLTKDPIVLAKAGDNTLLSKSLQLQKSAKMMKKAMKKEVKNFNNSILSSYNTLAKELKKIKKDTLKSDDNVLVKVVETTMDNSKIFDANLVKEVKKETKDIIIQIDKFWEDRKDIVDNDSLTNAMKLVSDIAVSLPTPSPSPTLIPTPIPSSHPTPSPSPTLIPTSIPSSHPTAIPSPTFIPTPTPSSHPTATPSPTLIPTSTPSSHPTPSPTPTPQVTTDIVLDNKTNLMWIDDTDTNSDTKIFSQAQNYCTNLSIDEYSDWRVPSLRELFTIVDLEKYNPAIDDKFKYTAPFGYWSSDSYSLDNALVMGINFYDGSDGLSDKITPRYIRCVRGESLPTTSFTRGDNDIVIESTKNLEWQDSSELKDSFLTYTEAISYCNSLTLSNYDNWRVPTIKELRSIVDRSRINPAINQAFLNSVNSFFWSSTLYQVDTKKVWSIFFADGNDYQLLKKDKAYIRCVR